MKKIVIFKDEMIGNKKVRTTLRSITPGFEWQGYTKTGQVIDSEMKKLAKALEPGMTGCYAA